MAKQSAGVLKYRLGSEGLDVLLVHPGGPFWRNKDEAAWSLPKGEYADGENALEAAKREFTEETGISIDGDFVALGEIRQPSGKVIAAWAVEGDCSIEDVSSNTFEMEWPPKSGKFGTFPEVDAVEWFPIEVAESKILKGQRRFLEILTANLSYIPNPDRVFKRLSEKDDQSTQGSLF